MKKLFEGAPKAAKSALLRGFGGVNGSAHKDILAQKQRRQAPGSRKQAGRNPARKGCEHFGDNSLTVPCIQRNVSLK
jgi:hypothetical protein